MERTRGGAYVSKVEGVRLHSRHPTPRGLVEGPRLAERTLHSAKRMVSKSEARRACQRGWVERREAARTAKFVTLETFHASRGWLKADALSKVPCTRQSEW